MNKQQALLKQDDLFMRGYVLEDSEPGRNTYRSVRGGSIEVIEWSKDDTTDRPHSDFFIAIVEATKQLTIF